MSKIFAVKPLKGQSSDGPKARLVRAERESQVKSYILGDFAIEAATPEEAHELAKMGIEIEDASEE